MKIISYIFVTSKEDQFANLPEDIAIKILGKFPITSIMTFKCVCKSWRRLIEGDKFMMSYTPKPSPAFVHRNMDMGYTVRDEAFKPLFRFGSPSQNQPCIADFRVVTVSNNGLLSAWNPWAEGLFICNPMTRECVELPPLSTNGSIQYYGFGVSKISRQFKILCSDGDSSCHVYTPGQGTGLWRSVAAASPGKRRLARDCTVFFNGSLHWLASDPEKKFLVCCFDLETELFTSFSVPSEYSGNIYGNNRLYILEGRLFLCDILNWRGVIIWKMNNYGDANSWVKEYSFTSREVYPHLYVIQVLENGDLLFAVSARCSVAPSNDRLYIYSKNTKNSMKRVTFVGSKQKYSSNIIVYTPSLISLASMGFHNVQSLNFY